MQDRQNTSKQTQHVYLFAAIGSTIEHTFMHPVDTTVRRLQNYRHRVTAANLHAVMFPDLANPTVLARFQSVYKGFFSAGSHKMVVRSYKFGTQPVAVRFVDDQLGASLRAATGEATGAHVVQGVAGCLVGAAEALFTPLDTFKIKRQLGNHQSMWSIIKTERLHLFNGTGAAISRNVPGSFALFSVSSMMKSGYEKRNQQQGLTHLSLAQHFISASVGAVAAAVVTNPQDVIKTRVMAASGKVSAFSILKQTINKEGTGALWKGLLLRSSFSIPKLGLPLTLAFFLPEMWDRYVEKRLSTNKMKP